MMGSSACFTRWIISGCGWTCHPMTHLRVRTVSTGLPVHSGSMYDARVRGQTDSVTSPADDHYRYLYRNLNPVPMNAREHTAQFISDEAAEIQQEFVRGEVCAVVLDDVRAGRGRRRAAVGDDAKHAADHGELRAASRACRTANRLGGTRPHYAQRRSHDLSRFQDPRRWWRARRSPYVPLGNERIDRRHATRWRWPRSSAREGADRGDVGAAGEFFLGSPAPVARVWPYLSPVPSSITESLRRVLPEDVQRQIGVETGAWAEELCALLETYVRSSPRTLTGLRSGASRPLPTERGISSSCTSGRSTPDAATAHRPARQPECAAEVWLPDRHRRIAHDLLGRPGGRKLELSGIFRRQFTSTARRRGGGGREAVDIWGVYRLPDRELIGNYYAVCKECSFTARADDDLDPVCPSCGTVQTGVRRSYWRPEFGFVALRQVRNPGMIAPSEAGTGRHTSCREVRRNMTAPGRWRTAARLSPGRVNAGS